MKMSRMSIGEIIFQYINYILLTVFGFVMLAPLLSVLATSLSNPHAVSIGKVSLLPVNFTIASWEYILGLWRLWSSLLITAIVTVTGTALSLFLNSLMAFPLSKKEFAPGKLLLVGITVTMIFKAPLIPYFLTVKAIGLYNNILVLILPSLFGAYYLIIMVTFMRQLPKELEESAIIDGCGYTQVLFRIILPSSKAMLATIGLYFAISYWNQFQHPLIFIENQKLFPLQITIRSFIIGDDTIKPVFDADMNRLYNPETVKSAVVIFCMLPIIAVYPFLQKYFIKGTMIGSIKG